MCAASAYTCIQVSNYGVYYIMINYMHCFYSPVSQKLGPCASPSPQEVLGHLRPSCININVLLKWHGCWKLVEH